MNITNAQLLSFDIENFRKIEKLEHTLAGSVTLIGGPNANGKTAIIKAMQVAFQGKDALPATPVRKGADKSVITLKINTDTHGILTCVITDKPDGKHEIVVTSELGGVMPSPQTMLKSMVSPFSGDPIALAKLEGKDLVKGVMATCGLDFTDVNFRRQRAFDERKMANQDVTRLKGQLSGLPVVPEGTPDTEQSAESVNAELTAAMGHNNKLSELKAASDAAAFRLKSANEKIEGQREKIGSTEAEILALTSRLESEKKTLASFNEQLPAIEKAANAAADATASFVPIDVNPIQVKIANLSNMNQNVWRKAERVKVSKALAEAEAKSKALTQAIESCDAQKQSMVKNANLPVEGLEFADDDLLYNGFSLGNDASMSEKLKVTVPLVFNQCPSLKLVFSESGDCLDEDTLRELADITVACGGHLMLERVGKTVDQVRLTLTDVNPIMLKDGALFEGAE